MAGIAAMLKLTPSARGCKPAARVLSPLLATWIWLCAPAPVLAQTTCALGPDEHNPSEKVLRCGDQLTIRNAPTDVSPGTGPLTVKRWGKPRVDALMARFGM